MFDADILYVCYTTLHIHNTCVRMCVLVTFANVCIKMVARHRTTVCNFSLRFQFAEITIKQVLCIGFIISAFCSHSNRWTGVKRKNGGGGEDDNSSSSSSNRFKAHARESES